MMCLRSHTPRQDGFPFGYDPSTVWLPLLTRSVSQKLPWVEHCLCARWFAYRTARTSWKEDSATVLEKKMRLREAQLHALGYPRRVMIPELIDSFGDRL